MRRDEPRSLLRYDYDMIIIWLWCDIILLWYDNNVIMIWLWYYCVMITMLLWYGYDITVLWWQCDYDMIMIWYDCNVIWLWYDMIMILPDISQLFRCNALASNNLSWYLLLHYVWLSSAALCLASDRGTNWLTFGVALKGRFKCYRYSRHRSE